MLLRRALVVALASLAILAFPAKADGPSLETPAATLDAALSCPATFSHPAHEPVLLVHGTGATAEQNWSWGYQPGLTAAGYDVCVVHLPGRSLGDIQVSSEYVVHAIRVMHAATGRLVDVVGHSQGGLQPRWAVKWWPDVLASVDDVAGMGSPNHGTYAAAACVWQCPAAAWQMRAGSQFLNALNGGDETPGAASYTSIFSQFDLVVTPQVPTSTSALAGASNIAVQDVCPGRPIDHVGMASDAATFAIVVDALANPGPTVVSRIPTSVCTAFGVPGADYSKLFSSGGFPNWTDWSATSAEPALKPYAA